MAGSLRLPNVGPRTRRVLQIGGYILLALVTFVMALQLTFPYDRVKARIEHELASKYVVSIGDVERGWVPGRVYFNSISLRTRPAKASDTPSTVYIDRLMVDVGILPLIGGTAKVRFDAAIGPGSLSGTLALSKTLTSIHVTGEDLPSQMLPMREIVSLPMSGTLQLAVDLDLPSEAQKSGKLAPNWQKAEGSLSVACPQGCTFGDGKTRLKSKLPNARMAALAEEGIEFGKVNMTSLEGAVEIKDGQLKVTKFDAKSNDGTVFVDFALELQPSLDDSTVTGCLRFNGSQDLLKRDAKTFTALTATGALLGPDNLFHIRLTDKLKTMKKLAQPCGPAVAGKSMDSPGVPTRPSLVVPPSEPARADAGVPTYTPPPPPPIETPAPDAAVNVPVPGPDLPGSAAPPPTGIDPAAGSAAAPGAPVTPGADTAR